MKNNQRCVKIKDQIFVQMPFKCECETIQKEDISSGKKHLLKMISTPMNFDH